MARYRGWEPTLHGLGGISQWRIYLCILSTLRLWTKRGMMIRVSYPIVAMGRQKALINSRLYNILITKLLLTPQVGYETNSEYARIVQEHSTPFGLLNHRNSCNWLSIYHRDLQPISKNSSRNYSQSSAKTSNTKHKFPY